jgi:hypothetical protein
LHFFEKTLLGSTEGLLRYIANDVENDLDECTPFEVNLVDEFYREAIQTREEIVNYLTAIKEAHVRLEGDPQRVVKCTALMVRGLDVPEILDTIQNIQQEIGYLWETVNERYKYLSKIVTTIENHLGVSLESFRIQNMVA